MAIGGRCCCGQCDGTHGRGYWLEPSFLAVHTGELGDSVYTFFQLPVMAKRYPDQPCVQFGAEVVCRTGAPVLHQGYACGVVFENKINDIPMNA
jgi:hypothetical protein